jgi:hypothetical protein
MHPQFTAADLDLFWSRVDKSGECWLWNGPTDWDGYGLFKGVRTNRLSWELAEGAPLPAGMQGLHTCDTPGCVRNDSDGFYVVDGERLRLHGHIFAGTNRHNQRDKTIKGRVAKGDRHGYRLHPELLHRGDDHWTRRHPEWLARGDANGFRLHPEIVRRGERAPRAKLTEELVQSIRLRAASGETQQSIADSIGVTQGAVSAVIRRATWKHVP